MVSLAISRFCQVSVLLFGSEFRFVYQARGEAGSLEVLMVDGMGASRNGRDVGLCSDKYKYTLFAELACLLIG